MGCERIFYVYALFRHDTCEPFYIGKGKGERIAAHSWKRQGTNPRKARILAKAERAGAECPRVVLRSNLTETEAFECEIALIAALGRADREKGPLVNLTDGGEGVSGLRFTMSEETRAKKSAIAKAKGIRPPRRSFDELSSQMRGKAHSPESREKIRSALIGKPRPPEVAEKIAVANRTRNHSLKGKPQNPELVAKRSTALKGRKLSAEHREKLSQAALARYARK